jgi:hypothetical protein
LDYAELLQVFFFRKTGRIRGRYMRWNAREIEKSGEWRGGEKQNM